MFASFVSQSALLSIKKRKGKTLENRSVKEWSSNKIYFLKKKRKKEKTNSSVILNDLSNDTKLGLPFSSSLALGNFY